MIDHILIDTYRRLENRQPLADPEDPDILAYVMEAIVLLQTSLKAVKEHVCDAGFVSTQHEVAFFKHTKPELLGNSMFYNKVFRIESASPRAGDKIKRAHFSHHLREIKKQHQQNLKGEEFYRYYRSGRTDLDLVYYCRGNIDYKKGMDSFIFEIDPEFSTYYDFKVARIIANDLLYAYLSSRLLLLKSKTGGGQVVDVKDLKWSESANALIELIYALYAAEVFSKGRISIRGLSRFFQEAFGISLNEIHHAFHRMKTRSGSRTVFLDRLKLSLEDYMDRNL